MLFSSRKFFGCSKIPVNSSKKLSVSEIHWKVFLRTKGEMMAIEKHWMLRFTEDETEGGSCGHEQEFEGARKEFYIDHWNTVVYCWTTTLSIRR